MLGGSGALVVWHYFGRPWGPNEFFLVDFRGLTLTLGAVGAQFAPGPPGLFHPPLPNGGPKIDPKSNNSDALSKLC